MADWYEEHKDDFEIALFRCIDHIPSVYDEENLNNLKWFIDGRPNHFKQLSICTSSVTQSRREAVYSKNENNKSTAIL